MSEDFEVYAHHRSPPILAREHARPAVSQRRTNAWYRDVAASAIAISRWEDDGGRPAPASVSGATPRSSGGRMPRGNRDI